MYLSCETVLFTADHELWFLPSSGDTSTDFILWLTQALKYHILYLGLSEKNASRLENVLIQEMTALPHYFLSMDIATGNKNCLLRIQQEATKMVKD